MKAFHTYLNFDGNTRDAMTFYQKCLGAELSMQSFNDVKMDVPKGSGDRIVHARLAKGSAVIMASDTMPGMPFTRGNNFSISIDCDTVPETQKLFKAFGDGGQVTMELQDTFWGAHFGMLTDRFGVNWMFNCELSRKG